MGLRWRDDGGGGWTLVDEGAGWDGSDLEVGSVSHLLRPDAEGYGARYWGRAESLRYVGPSPDGKDSAQVGGLWPSAVEAREAVEEAHAGHRSCERAPWD